MIAPDGVIYFFRSPYLVSESLRKNNKKKPVMINAPERLMPREKHPLSAITPIRAGTMPPPKRKATGMVKDMAIFLFSGELIIDSAAKPAG